jgi:opacity protein-like surface antigen
VRQAAAVGLAVFVLVALPDSARSDTAKAIVEGAAGAALIGILCSSVVLTVDDEVDKDDFARRGWLIGLGGSYGVETFEDAAESDFRDDLPSAPVDPEFPDPVSLSVDNSLGVNGRVGYRCHRYFSAEVEVEWNRFSSDLTQPGYERLANVVSEPVVVTANVKGYFLTGRYQPFLLLGAGVMSADIKLRDPVGLEFTGLKSRSENEFAMRFGGGIDLYATEHVVVSLEANYVLPFSSLETLDDMKYTPDYITVSWGFQYRF